MPASRKIGEGRPRLLLVDELAVSLRLDDLYLSIRALASYSGLSARRLRDLLRDPAHPLPHFKIGAKLLVRKGDYDQWALRYRQVGDAQVEAAVDDLLKRLAR